MPLQMVASRDAEAASIAVDNCRQLLYRCREEDLFSDDQFNQMISLADDTASMLRQGDDSTDVVAPQVLTVRRTAEAGTANTDVTNEMRSAARQSVLQHQIDTNDERIQQLETAVREVTDTSTATESDQQVLLLREMALQIEAQVIRLCTGREPEYYHIGTIAILRHAVRFELLEDSRVIRTKLSALRKEFRQEFGLLGWIKEAPLESFYPDWAYRMIVNKIRRSDVSAADIEQAIESVYSLQIQKQTVKRVLQCLKELNARMNQEQLFRA